MPARTALVHRSLSTALAHRSLSTAFVQPALRPLSAEDVSDEVEAVVDASARRLFSLFERHGSSDYIGEPMSITEHSVQTANAALKAGETDMAVLACLLHDVGHLCGLEAGHAPGMGGCGTPDHERIGADFLGALGLPQDIAYLCHHHVGAKRYLCATVPGYEERLSEASRVTLQHQGGPMSPAEVAAADADPRWPLVLRMRGYDEAGKDPHAAATSPRDFEAPLRAALRASVVQQLDAAAASPLAYPLSPFASGYLLSQEQLRFWDEQGYLTLRQALPPATAAALSAMADEAAALPRGACYPWLLHDERSRVDGEVRICRVENFVKHHRGWGEVGLGLLQQLVAQAFRAPAVLFKDKINFKGPGGGGFLAHQDATAYATDKLASRHISVRLPIDDSTTHNGPLEVAPGQHRRGILPHETGIIVPEQEAVMRFEPLLVSPGDVVLFDSYLPHRSSANHSDTWRRSGYYTYNLASEGDFHAAYYAEKAETWAAGEGGKISITNDFGGDIVS